MRVHRSQLALLVVGLVCRLGFAQTSQLTGGAEARLEAHKGQTSFKIGDPIVLDLVFTAKSPGYVVDTNPRTYLPTSDEVNSEPTVGWVRTHSVFRGEGSIGGVEPLNRDPIRVAVLLNRTITFKDPGHYEVTLTTERLRVSGDSKLTSPEDCEPCRTTNAVGIELSRRDDSEEAALVASLTRELGKPVAKVPEPSPEQKQEIEKLMEEQQKIAADSPDAKKQQETLIRKMYKIISDQTAKFEEAQEARYQAAIRLAYLTGDDAVRARTHFIAAEREAGEGRPVAVILRDGLPNSRNKQLQLDLLEEAWSDPLGVPTYQLQTALRQAKELLHSERVTDEAVLWAGTPEEHQAAMTEYQREIEEIIASLPRRSESNRADAITFLKRQGIPNQFNHPTGNSQSK